MKKKILWIVIISLVVVVVGISLIVFLISQGKSQENLGQESENTETLEIKEGKYLIEANSEDIQMGIESEATVELNDGVIEVSDDSIYQIGEYQIEGDRIKGFYTEISYLDHSRGGATTKKAIQEKFEYEILEDGSIRDLTGYGSYLDKNFHKGDVYTIEPVIPRGRKIPDIEL